MNSSELLKEKLELARENYRKSADNCLEARGNRMDYPYSLNFKNALVVAEAEHDNVVAAYDTAFDAYMAGRK